MRTIQKTISLLSICIYPLTIDISLLLVYSINVSSFTIRHNIIPISNSSME